MASFVTKIRNWKYPLSWIRHFELLKCIPIYSKTRENRGNRNRKVDLCIKGCLGSKESASIIEIPRYINTV